ncbi:hypothetical protein ABT294_00450 [Nonomuraea sp. NPDC000554]|uniref:hypothetical protein n=1 Tax=Nonomuraea sp. NPDC000554 TaxID=3154259 RepID=UPI0033344546
MSETYALLGKILDDHPDLRAARIEWTIQPGCLTCHVAPHLRAWAEIERTFADVVDQLALERFDDVLLGPGKKLLHARAFLLDDVEVLATTTLRKDPTM